MRRPSKRGPGTELAPRFLYVCSYLKTINICYGGLEAELKTNCMTLNGKQLAALVKMGVAMAMADGKVEEVEKVAIAFELVKFGVTSNDAAIIINNSQQMDASDAIATLSCMTTEQKKYATGYLAAIMASDHDIDPSEVKLWQVICTLSSFPTMNIRDALSFWNEH